MQYQSLQFAKKEDELEVTLYNLYTFSIPLDDVKRICPVYKIEKNSVDFEMKNKEKAEGRFNLLITKYIRNLKNKMSGFLAVYVHKNAGIPLFGLQFLGIVDKGSEMLEIKPITNCNMNCTFCSVDEGPDSSKQVDFIVEEDYLVEELGKLLEFKKKSNPAAQFNIWINPHGEPLLYAPILSLCERIGWFKNVGQIYIITNGVLLNKPLIDAFAKNKKVQLNVSISGFDDAKAKEMMGSTAYSISRILEMVEYAAQKMLVTVTPVYVAGHNDDQLGKIIEFVKKVGCKIAIQKFCYNKLGRNPIKEKSWDEFFAQLKELEKKHCLVLLGELGKLQQTEQLPKAFKKDDVILAQIVSPGRMRKDKICSAKGYSILVPGCEKESGKIKVKIIQDKYNLYIGKL
ncbi:radical SAM protein [Candidatus Woesearchaeota archaeon]|nr:radical SAM protein [Candidatus Woesearchaeota archaeon]